ncbi:glycosyltransferase family 4 protein [Gammaproteobacteria bacterium]|nr:glycosyltransferase family 4 protein [Gammaproteobacteria bacterium]
MKKVFMFVNVDWFFLSHRLPIAKAALKNNIDMTVYAEFTKAQYQKQDKGYSLLDSPIKRSSRSILHFFLEFLKAYKIIREGKPNIIHAVTIKPILVLGIIARITSTPFIGSVSGLGPAFIADSFLKKLRLKLILVTLKFICSRKETAIICQTDHDREVLIAHKLVLSEQILLINGSGVDIDKYTPSKKNISAQKYILMSSRILLDKGVQDFCIAAGKVQKKFGREIKFKLSGPIDNLSPTGISKNEINQLADKYGVEYLGNRPDMPELLASALIFVLPSYYPEGLPKVLLEAAASGVPIITTDHPGCRDAIINRKTGLLVPIKDPDSLASAMRELLINNALLKNMGQNARSLAEISFKDSSVVSSHYSLYHQFK